MCRARKIPKSLHSLALSPALEFSGNHFLWPWISPTGDAAQFRSAQLLPAPFDFAAGILLGIFFAAALIRVWCRRPKPPPGQTPPSTDHEHLSHELQKARQRLEEAQQIGKLGFWEWETASDEIYWSDELFRIFGLEPRQHPPTYDQFLEMIHPDDRSRFDEFHRQAIIERDQVEIEYRICRPDGQTRHLFIRARLDRPAHDPGKLRIVGATRDITRRKQAQAELDEYRHNLEDLVERRTAELRQINNELRDVITHRKQVEYELRLSEQILEQMPDAIVVTDREYIITRWLGRAEAIFGYPGAEAIGQPATMLIAEGEHNPEVLTQLAETGQFLGETLCRRKDGAVFPVETSAARLYDAQGRHIGFVGISKDISERKRAETALTESDCYNRMLFEQSIIGQMLCTIDGNPVDVNAACAAIVGCTIDEMYKLKRADLFADSSEAAVRRRQHALEHNGQFGPCEMQWRHKAGHTVPVRMSSRVLERRNERLIWSCVEDITEEKEAERSRRGLEIQLEQSRKFESLGVLAGGIAHDFNNLLMGILGNTELAMMELAPNDPARRSLRQVESAGMRAADLCRQMLAYSGRGSFITERTNLNELLREMNELIAASACEKIDIVYELDSRLPAIQLDVNQMRQLIINLVKNASEAIGDEQGRITIRTLFDPRSRDEVPDAWLKPGIADGPYLRLEVEDTGHGIDPSILEKIFEPFFSTRFVGRGLGLPAVFGIVRSHRGAIGVTSRPGHGTILHILLPVGHRTSPKPEGRAVSPLNGKTILVVDDERMVLELAEKILERSGARVLAAEDGAEALERFKINVDRIDAVLLDLTMPRMSGREVRKRMQQIQPDVPVILMSGYSEEEAFRQFAGERLAGFLAKPFSADKLVSQMERILANED